MYARQRKGLKAVSTSAINEMKGQTHRTFMDSLKLDAFHVSYVGAVPTQEGKSCFDEVHVCACEWVGVRMCVAINVCMWGRYVCVLCGCVLYVRASVCVCVHATDKAT